MKKHDDDMRWTVLLVEDHESTRDAIATYLDRVGFKVTAVADAQSLPFARETHGRPFDVVVSDVHLPGMSGIELASLLLAGTPSQPIILITGDPDEALAREALSRGPVNYLLKPFELFELEAAIRNTLVAAMNRSNVAPPVRKKDSTVAGIPADWLKWVDDRSYAGAGHANRLARLCHLLVPGLPRLEIDLDEVQLAAYCHELGLMSGAASDPIIGRAHV